MGIFDFLKPKEMKDKLDGLPKTLNGPSKALYDNGNIRVERNYSEGKLHGPFKNYYENGKLRGEGNFNNGELDGALKFETRNFISNEIVKFEINNVNGEKHGTCREFYEDGKLKTECYFNNGEFEDFKSWKEYLKDGTFKSPPEVDFGDFFLFSIPSEVLNEVDLRRKLKQKNRS